ncbi:MAG: hypothetical protein C4326_03915 [Ignavibacteria bacterium]
MNPLRFVSLLLALALVLAACKKDSSNPAGTTLSINGTWTITGATVNGTPTDPAQVFEFVEGEQYQRGSPLEQTEHLPTPSWMLRAEPFTPKREHSPCRATT